MNAKACALTVQGNYPEAIQWQEKALTDKQYAEDKDSDGGVVTQESIAAWRQYLPWLGHHQR